MQFVLILSKYAIDKLSELFIAMDKRKLEAGMEHCQNATEVNHHRLCLTVSHLLNALKQTATTAACSSFY